MSLSEQWPQIRWARASGIAFSQCSYQVIVIVGHLLFRKRLSNDPILVPKRIDSVKVELLPLPIAVALVSVLVIIMMALIVWLSLCCTRKAEPTIQTIPYREKPRQVVRPPVVRTYDQNSHKVPNMVKNPSSELMSKRPESPFYSEVLSNSTRLSNVYQLYSNPNPSSNHLNPIQSPIHANQSQTYFCWERRDISVTTRLATDLATFGPTLVMRKISPIESNIFTVSKAIVLIVLYTLECHPTQALPSNQSIVTQCLHMSTNSCPDFGTLSKCRRPHELNSQSEDPIASDDQCWPIGNPIPPTTTNISRSLCLSDALTQVFVLTIRPLNDKKTNPKSLWNVCRITVHSKQTLDKCFLQLY